jgi:hypothetical protein
MIYCSMCGTQQPVGTAFCSACGNAVARTEPAARQQLAQAGLEVQAHNLWLLVGRLVGLVVAGLVVWFVVGPALANNALALLAAIALAAIVGIVGGQWVVLLLLRR